MSWMKCWFRMVCGSTALNELWVGATAAAVPGFAAVASVDEEGPPAEAPTWPRSVGCASTWADRRMRIQMLDTVIGRMDFISRVTRGRAPFARASGGV